MLLGYIDEIGEPGAFVAKDHPRYNTSPAFGYAGIVIPSGSARAFGAIFNNEKQALFRREIAEASHPGRWERKGASIFRPDTPQTYPQQIRVFCHLVRKLRALGGSLVYYADEKPLGTPGQVRIEPEVRETAAMQETLNRLARHADRAGQNIMVMIDQINEKTRAQRLPNMYGHILGRAGDFPEMRRIIEPPMHVDSVLSSNIQFADWVAACTTRAIEYQLIRDSPFEWITGSKLEAVKDGFTFESKLHLWHRSVDDLNKAGLFKPVRPLYPRPVGHLLSSALPPDAIRRVRAAAERGHGKK